MTLRAGDFSATIPFGLFKVIKGREYSSYYYYHGIIDGVELDVFIFPTGAKRYASRAVLRGANLTGLKDQMPVTLTIGNDTGTGTVNARVFQ